MRYAGFWVRLWAGALDALVFLPITAAHFWLQGLSWGAAVAGNLLFAFAYSFYNIYFHGRWGQTLGKMALGIRVRLKDGSRITWRAAVLRHIVDLGFSVWTSVTYIVTMTAIPREVFESQGWLERARLMAGELPWWYGWVNNLWMLWVVSELVVLLTNRKRRALHDFIAGTVVTHIR